MSGESVSSHKFKNTPSKPKQSPVQIKEKLRRSYRNKVQRCRDRLRDKFRDMHFVKENMCNMLKDLMYRDMTDTPDDIQDVEDNILEEIRDELVEEELEWWLEEYQKSQMDNVDWSNVEQENDIVCPVCQKENFVSASDTLKCSRCNIQIKTSMHTSDVKDQIYKYLDRHNSVCVSDPQFTVIKDGNDSHIYLICETCSEMSFVL